MSDLGATNGTAPGTLVQLGAAAGEDVSDLLRGRGSFSRNNEVSPALAVVLAAVLLAATEQVNARKLAAFSVTSREELSILQLAMAFRGDDTGLTGDVFEWSLLLALSGGDADLAQIMTDALWLVDGIRVQEPLAVLVAAEPGRLVAYSPDLPERAALATGRRGRPPYVANLLASADSRRWKSDLVIGGDGERWVGASLKSNPRDLQRSLRQGAGTPYPPRMGITASYRPGITRDAATGAVLVHVPVEGHVMGLSKLVLTDVLEAFSRDLALPDTPLRQDATGIGRQLYRWQNRTVAYVANILLQKAADISPMHRSLPTTTGASEPDANGALIAINTLSSEEWDPERGPGRSSSEVRRRYAQFDPID
ncbi:hypothetical protein ABFT23_04665 [Nocardioides sp. C4-1]|uniref:hypothetical protein n=1 Tax=Nocardioides sp. C4-1 TaxID=3151851 RepID=UPI003267A44B